MTPLRRRSFLKQTLATTAGGWSLLRDPSKADEAITAGKGLRLARFRFDVTPPSGHSLCGGWIPPVVDVDDSLEAIGFVLLGVGEPVVVCAVDWTGILNEAHVRWRRALAEAAGTASDRVAVQCVHQHNAPFACLGAEQITQQYAELPHIVEPEFFAGCLDRGRTAVKDAMAGARPVTHIAHGQARVEKVASNRRVARDESGRVTAMRGSSCQDGVLRDLPEGLIDPWLKTVAFYDGETKIAASHYYATHPMSYYGDGRVSGDFAGLARRLRQADDPACLQIYFTGCAGNIAAGKYNDGSPEARRILTGRVYDGMTRSEATLTKTEVTGAAWRALELLPPPRANLSEEALQAQIADPSNSVVERNRPSYMLSWLQRVERRIPIVLSSLRINDVSLLHLPAECFVEYQLRAQNLDPQRFVATAAYGDGGPWYIPVADEFPAGGYEVSAAFCEPEVDRLITRAMAALLG